jgi:nucleoside-diphosphate-sugar epimerase
VIYFKDAARAIVALGQAPRDAIQTTNYVLAGAVPTASAGELAAIVRAKVPGAQITFEPNREWQAVVDRLALPLDDRNARLEWQWSAQYDQERMVDDFLGELRLHPQRYA